MKNLSEDLSEDISREYWPTTWLVFPDISNPSFCAL